MRLTLSLLVIFSAALVSAQTIPVTLGSESSKEFVAGSAEAGMTNPQLSAGASQASHAWRNTVREPFSLAYTAATRTLTLSVGNDQVSRPISPGFTDLWIRTEATRSRDLLVALSDLAITATGTRTPLSRPRFVTTSWAQDVAELHLGSGAVADGWDWILTGHLGLSWTYMADTVGGRASVGFILGSRSDPTVVPEPASMAVLGLGLAAFKRRRKA